MFDERSFSKESFDERSWFFGAVEEILRRIKLLRAKFVLIQSNEIFVRKAPDERTR